MTDRKSAARIASAILGLSLVLLAGSGRAASAGPIPENAHAISYGEGWKCDPSFQSTGDDCVAITAPANGYLTGKTYGKGWECRHGFEEVDGARCQQIAVPDGAYLAVSGVTWRCSRAFRKVDGACERINIPENAYLAHRWQSGSDWFCDMGYAKATDRCIAIDVPANAFLNTSITGSPWICQRGYIEMNGGCALITVPENGFLTSSLHGRQWACERGFVASGDACAAVIVPENAHLDYSGDRWKCDRDFRLVDGVCILPALR